MNIYEQDGMFIAEMEYQSERIIKFGKTWEEAKENLLVRLLVLEMIG
ncbi:MULTISPECIES: hypothetical protein [Brevibacillus]|jgi:hypothetical protein|nr:hypothetical protein [Brevibacillus borstelensis]MBE5396477.1 hypothetical protein [Brevibacillus borstelensis]MCM3559279.1 hypothetical protein [Brevibacillus borstelensis]MED1746522.1 hypothetical protein [Brevibacillus borstelensis]MED1852660.1 hypothetical protein [Brevibacillus borstelensis]MED1885134.1 hypothetical protein [Brevibacillus borstelensis]